MCAQRKVFLKVGQRFGRGVVVDPEIHLPLTEGRKKAGSRSGPRGALMRCDCGNEYKVITGNLTSGMSRSCGCLATEARATLGRTMRHGLSHHPNFPRWRAMIDRCEKPSNPAFYRYGGRGIAVAEEWHDPAVFVAYLETELGPCPEGHSLDRIDNDGNYEPGNIRWADPITQRHNQRPYSGPKVVRTHCREGHEYTTENTIKGKKGRRCRACRNASELSRARAAAKRARQIQPIPADLLSLLVGIAERAMASDPNARDALEELEFMGLYDMPINVTAWIAEETP